MMPVPATTYVGEPDIPAGLTISEYRRSRPRCTPWWRRIPPKFGTIARPRLGGVILPSDAPAEPLPRSAPTSGPPRSRPSAPSCPEPRSAEETATMTVPVFATSYVGEPDIPAWLTISE
jgi:hypothetical protein